MTNKEVKEPFLAQKMFIMSQGDSFQLQTSRYYIHFKGIFLWAGSYWYSWDKIRFMI